MMSFSNLKFSLRLGPETWPCIADGGAGGFGAGSRIESMLSMQNAGRTGQS